MKKFLILFTMIISLTFTGCYSWFESKVDMDDKTPKINLAELLYKEKEITSLEAPTQVIVSKGQYSGTIKLHWDEVPYATSYRLERAIAKPDSETGNYSIPEEGEFEVLSKYVYSCNYSDIILPSPSEADPQYTNHYYYRVSAENIQKGLESSEFTPINNSTCGWLLKPPASISAAKGENPDYIEIKWSAVDQANRYLIYRGEKANGLGMEYLDSVTGDTCRYQNDLATNEKGIEFYYKVCAVLSDGSQSAFTGLALGYSAKEGAPVPPANIKIKNGLGESKKSLTITWDKVDKSGYTVSYSVYRTSSIDSIYTLVRNNVSGSGDSISFTDESLLKTGVEYYYYVQTVAVKNDDSSDVLKSPFSKTGPDADEDSRVVGWLLSPPNNCEVADSTENGKSVLRWTPAVGSAKVNYRYNIYYSDTLDGVYQLLVQDVDPAADDSNKPILGQDGYYNLVVDKKPFYRVSTLNDDAGQESDKGQTVAPCPSAPTNVIASKTSSLNGLQNYTPNTNGVYPVQITWSAPANENPYGYYVYRSTKPDSSFRKITDTPVTGNSLQFIDNNETARAGTFYYYKVVSLNMLMQGKNANVQNADSRGYGALTRDQWFREYNKTIMHSQAKLTLMNKSNDMDKLGKETINGDICGTLTYNAAIAGLGADITMHYEKYADYYANNDKSFGYYFCLTGNTDTSANMSSNGNMKGTNTADTSGMYPGYAKYDKLEIKSGAAGGGYYIVCTKDKNGNVILSEANVDWTVGEDK